jgi:hypothetical protein
MIRPRTKYLRGRAAVTGTWLSILFLLTPTFPIAAQETDLPPQTPDSLRLDRNGALSVFLDCNRCDGSYIRREITFVDHINRRDGADVHVLVTDEETGGGGRRYTFDLIGRGQFEGQNYSTVLVTRPFDTEDDERRDIVRTLAVALAPYLMQTPLREHLSLGVEALDESDASVDDRWNGWTVEVYGDGSGDLEASQASLDLRYGVYIDRVTETWKIRIRPYFNYGLDRFEQDDETIRSESRRDGLESYVIRSVSEHWSVGLFGDVLTETFSNIDLRLRASPAVEYSVFPYREASRRELTVAYRMGLSHIQYRDTTIFDEIVQMLPGHAANATYELTQPWGSLDLSIEGSQFLHDLTKYRFELDGGISLQVSRGLSVRVGGEVELIHDQINLEKGDATLEELLLRRRQLATNFEIRGSVGFRYRFGSIYNNVVNTRL